MDRTRGYTVLELLVTLAISLIVIGMVAPAFADMIKVNNLLEKRNRLFRDLVYARQSAVDLGRSVVICNTAPANGSCGSDSVDWDTGWVVFIDRNHDGRCTDADGNTLCDKDKGRILRQWTPRSRLPLTIRGNHNLARRVRFQSTGISPGYNGTITLCTEQEIRPRGIIVANTGRVRTADPDNLTCKQDT